MKLNWRPVDVCPFIGVCWGFGTLIVSFWPVVIRFGNGYGRRLDELVRAVGERG